MCVLEAERGRGRDEYPVRAVWNSLVAGVVFEHKSVEELRRELRRNTALCYICGFDVLKGDRCVPKAGAYSRFTANVLRHTDLLEKMFRKLRSACYELLPGEILRGYLPLQGHVHDPEGAEDSAGYGQEDIHPPFRATASNGIRSMTCGARWSGSTAGWTTCSGSRNTQSGG